MTDQKIDYSEDSVNVRLRELEVYTRYELKYLADSFRDLKKYVESSLDNESVRFEILSKKVNWLTVVILAQMAGLNLDAVLRVLKVLPL